MKSFRAAYIPVQEMGDDLNNISALLDHEPRQHIDNLLWSDSGYRPEASFAMAHTIDSILLKYYVREKYVNATYRHINDPVFKDTCVEFFIAFNNDSNYYNLEFNYVGTPLIAYGAGKNDRVYLSPQVIQTIKSYHTITPSGNNDGLNNWELTLRIPFTLFIHHQLTSLKDSFGRVNFYKCGDELPKPHFLSWSNIVYPVPNFHLPDFFGAIEFI